jgi:hypothetical protein
MDLARVVRAFFFLCVHSGMWRPPDPSEFNSLAQALLCRTKVSVCQWFFRLAQPQAGDASVLGMKYCFVDTEGIGEVELLVVDDHVLIRKALRGVLGRADDMIESVDETPLRVFIHHTR